MSISANQWGLINEIVLRIHQADEIRSMQEDFLTIVKALIDYDLAVFYVAEGDDYLANPYSVGLTDEDLLDYRENIHDDDPFKPLMGLLTDSHGAIRATDYSSIEEIKDTEYYKKTWMPKGIMHNIYLPISYNNVWLGSVSLFRKEEKTNFSDTEVELANVLLAHLQVRLEWNRKDKEKNLVGNLSASELKKVRASLMEKCKLTKRESEVACLWISGMTDAEICEALSISKNTLKKHISNLFGKLEIGNRVELIKLVSRL